MTAPEPRVPGGANPAPPAAGIPISPWEVLFLSSVADLANHLARQSSDGENPPEHTE
jgi:hypothetical protein